MPSATWTTLAIKTDNDQLKAGLRAVWKGRPQARSASQPAPGSNAVPPPEATSAESEAAALRKAMAGTTPLAPDNRVQLAKAPSRRLPPRPTPHNLNASSATRTTLTGDTHPAHWHHDGTRPNHLPHDPDARALAMAMNGVTPLTDCNRVVLGTPPPAPRPRQLVADEQAALHESLHGQIALQDRLEGGDEPQHLRAGLAQTVLRDLRRGRWVVQAQTDLHGLNRDEARHQLATFLASSLHGGLRCVRVIHGKGNGSPQKLSILRQLVRGWLAQRIEVLAYCQAQPHDGGEGALIVLLRTHKR